jgi:ketosteroid isomerase-like protein
MEAATQTGTQQTLHHHLAAFVAADLNELIKDYTEDSELFTPDGALKGVNAIRSFFSEVFKIFPEGSAFEVKQTIIRDDVAYIAWSGASAFVTIPLGTDTFIMQHNKILLQTLAASIIPIQQ